MNNMIKKVRLDVFLLLITFILLFLFYHQYQINQNLIYSLPEPYSTLWLNFDIENITSVERISSDIDYSSKKLHITSEFRSEVKNIKIHINPDFGEFCNGTVTEHGSQQWVSHQFVNNSAIFEMMYSKETSLILDYSCNIKENLVPNGKILFRIVNYTNNNLFAKNLKIIIDFKDSKYGCRDICISSDKFRIVDIDTKNGIRIINLNRTNDNVETQSMEIYLRTYDKDKKLGSDISFAFFTGLAIVFVELMYKIIYLKSSVKK